MIDGHNRYEIAQAHGLEFATTEMQFATRDDVKIWIIKNQLGRRNLPPVVRIKLAMLAEPLIAAQSKEKQGTRTDLTLMTNVINVTPDTPAEKNKLNRQNTTNAQLAQIASVSDRTVARYKKIQSDGSDEVKAQVDRGDISISAAYLQAKKKPFEKSNRKGSI